MPTPSQHTFSIADDFPQAKVDPTRLMREIRADATITIALDRIDTAGDVCDVWFRDTLPAEQITSLGVLGAAHSGAPLPEAAVDASGNPIVRLYADTSFGIPAVSVLNTPDASKGLVKAWQLTVAASTTDYYDIIIADDLVGPTGRCFLVGGEYRCRTPAAESSALHLAIVDRDDILGLFVYYGFQRTKLAGLTNIVGTRNVGDYATGDTSGHRAKILLVGSDYCEVTFHDGAFLDGETITYKSANGTPTGATATLGEWLEGDVVELQRNVKDEWIEGLDQRSIQPGGSKELPAGLYLRAIVHNASPTDPLRVKISFVLATM